MNQDQRKAFLEWLYGPYCPLDITEFNAGDFDIAHYSYQAALASPEVQGLRKDAERYRYLIAKLQQAYDGDYFETDIMSLYCHMTSQYKGERVVRAEITWRDKADELIGLSEAIDHARRIEDKP